MKDLEMLILSCYICEARAIVEKVKTFERIAYLTVESSIRHWLFKRLSRERERSWRSKGRLMQPMVVITLLYY